MPEVEPFEVSTAGGECSKATQGPVKDLSDAYTGHISGMGSSAVTPNDQRLVEKSSLECRASEESASGSVSTVLQAGDKMETKD